MNLDQFKNLNPKEIGSWPILPKVAVLAALFVVLITAGYLLDWSGQLDVLSAAEQEEGTLKTSFEEKKRQAVNLPGYRQQLKEIEQSFGSLLKQLPNKAQMDALLTDISQAGISRGLTFQLFKPAAQETMTEFYAELAIAICATGNYHDVAAFSSDVARLPRIVTLNDVRITGSASPAGGGLHHAGCNQPTGSTGLLMSATAKTYRYLDEEEIAAQKKAAKEKEKKAAAAAKPAEKEKGGHK